MPFTLFSRILPSDVANIIFNFVKKIQNTQKIYWEQTAPLLDFYHDKGILKEVDGLGEIPEITKRILDVLK